jgi:hypothetical protein
VVDDLVSRPGQRPSQPAQILPDRVGGQRLFRFVIEFGLDPIVVDHVTAMTVEEGEEPPEVGRQATWLASDQHEVSSPVDVPGLVEIVGKDDLLAASIAKRQGCPPRSRLCSRRKVACNYSEFDKDALVTPSSVNAEAPAA